MSENPEITAYRFNEFTLDLTRESLFGPEGETHLRPQAFLLLSILAEHAGELVSRDTLMDKIWGPTVVTEASITQCLAELRRTLGDRSHDLIHTVPRRGYMLDCSVKQVLSSKAKGRRILNKFSPVMATAASIVLLGSALVMRESPSPVGIFRPESSSSQSPAGAIEAQAQLQWGQFLYDRRRPGDLATALAAFEQAIAIEPGLAEAWAGISAIHYLRLFDADAPSGGVAAVVEPAERALALAPDNALVLERAARAMLLKGDREKARSLMKLAAELEPDNPLVLTGSALDEYANGNYQAAYRMQRRAMQLNPLNSTNQHNLGFIALAAGEYRESISAFQAAAELSPENGHTTSLYQAFAMLAVGDTSGALHLLRQYNSAVNQLAIQLIEDQNPSVPENGVDTIGLSDLSAAQEAIIRATFYAFRDQQIMALQSLAKTEDALILPDAPTDSFAFVLELLSLPWWKPMAQDEAFTRLRRTSKQGKWEQFHARVALAGNERVENPDDGI